MKTLNWYHLQELNVETIVENKLIKCYGIVMTCNKEKNFVSMAICDGTATVEATLYLSNIKYEDLQLPLKGDTVIVIGCVSIKQFGNENAIKKIIKIKINRFKLLSIQQQLQTMQTILIQRQNRLKQQCQNMILQKKVKMNKDNLFDDSRQIEIRTLILIVLYLILEHNPDLTSYIFSLSMLLTNKLSKLFRTENSLSQIFFTNLFFKNLKMLIEYQIIQNKQQLNQNECFYCIRRTFFDRIVTFIERLIFQKSQTNGIRIEQITKAVNEQLGIIMRQKSIINSKFVQKILITLINRNKIYKDSDKVLYSIH